MFTAWEKVGIGETQGAACDPGWPLSASLGECSVLRCGGLV